MPLGRRILHMRPEGRRSIRDLDGQLLVGTGDTLPTGEVGKIRPQPPSRAWATWGKVLANFPRPSFRSSSASDVASSSRTVRSFREARALSRCSSTGSLKLDALEQAEVRRREVGRGELGQDLSQLAADLALRIAWGLVHRLAESRGKRAQDTLGPARVRERRKPVHERAQLGLRLSSRPC